MEWQILAWGRLADAAAGGLIVLAVGSLAARLCRQPVRRARLVVLTLLGGVAVPCLGALPVAPRWSAGLLPPPALLGSRPDDEVAATAARSRLQPVRCGAIERAPSISPTRLGRRRRAPHGRILASPHRDRRSPPPGGGGPSPPRGRFCWGVISPWRPGWRPGGSSGQVVLWRVTRAARPVPTAVRDVFLGLTGPGGERVVLLESDRIALPFTYTWVRPVILLPTTLCDGREPGALRYVLAHEWSHVERRDAWAWNLACLAGLVLFYQPLFWWLRRQLRLCQDYLADARAAAAGSAEDYAAFLVRLARVRTSGPALPALGIGDRRSNLSRRVIMLVQDHEPLEHRCRAAWSLAAASAAAAVIVVASGLRLDAAAPPEAETPATEVKAVQDDAKTPGDPKPAGETLHYTGTVKDKDTGKPIAGATVVVRRSILR